MTNKELLEILEHTAQDGMADEPVLLALRAVVELHKPWESLPMVDFEQLNWCETCEQDYPCPTIQAIEKELQ